MPHKIRYILKNRKTRKWSISCVVSVLTVQNLKRDKVAVLHFAAAAIILYAAKEKERTKGRTKAG